MQIAPVRTRLEAAKAVMDASRIDQPRRPAAWRGLAAPTGSRRAEAEQEVSGVALILDA